jgi:hypothetical protein
VRLVQGAFKPHVHGAGGAGRDAGSGKDCLSLAPIVARDPKSRSLSSLVVSLPNTIMFELWWFMLRLSLPGWIPTPAVDYIKAASKIIHDYHLWLLSIIIDDWTDRTEASGWGPVLAAPDDVKNMNFFSKEAPGKGVFERRGKKRPRNCSFIPDIINTIQVASSILLG